MSLSRVKRISRELIKDSRGWFLKVITGTEENLSGKTGEIYFTCAIPGQTKGKHYHEKAQEWFTLILGNAVLVLEDIYTKERVEIELSAEKPETIFIPPFVAHSIENRYYEDCVLCAYTDKQYDPQDTINYNL
jgi:dTDP-4-dehydrorhamnose 3,5-epimerase-like enzyme